MASVFCRPYRQKKEMGPFLKFLFLTLEICRFFMSIFDHQSDNYMKISRSIKYRNKRIQLVQEKVIDGKYF